MKEEDYASVIEQFKNYKAKQKVEQNEEGEDAEDERTNEVSGNKRYISFILYMAVQEMIKQVFVSCK